MIDCCKVKLRDKRPLVDILHIILASRAEFRIALGPKTSRASKFSKIYSTFKTSITD